MALVVKDRVKETTTTTGTGTLTLAGASSGYQSFAAIGNGNTTYYVITDVTSGAWEVGIGTYTASGTTLSRDTVLSSSNAGSLVSFGAGIKDVFVAYPAERAVYLDSAGSYPVQATFNTLTATTANLTNGTVSSAPSSGTDITNKTYVDTVATTAIDFHEPVRGEVPNSTGNLTATYNNGASGVGATLTNAGTQATFAYGGVSWNTNDRVLIYNQTDATQNGVYVITDLGSGSTNWVLTRATDADSYSINDPQTLDQGSSFFVQEGDGAGETYACNTPGVITFGTTNITFTQISSSQIYSAGTGLTLTGTQFSITNTGTAGTYGSASAVPVLTTNAQGQVTSVTNTTIAIAGSQVSGAISGQAGSVANSLTLGTYLTGGSYNGSSPITATVDATSANTASKVVARDASGNFSAGTITAALSGNATTATTSTNLAGGAANQISYQSGAGTTAFATAPSASGQVLRWNGSAFDWVAGTISGASLGSNLSTLTLGSYLTGTSYNGSAGVTAAVDATSANTASKVVARDASGNFSAGTITATLSGNATTASTASNLSGGSAGTVPYQSAANTTAQLAAGTAGQVLKSNGAAAPSWVNGTISGVSLGSNLGTLTLNTSGTGLSGSTTYNGSGASTFTVTSNATSANTASTVVARDASGNFSAGTITASLSGNATTATTATNVSGGTASVQTLSIASNPVGTTSDIALTANAATNSENSWSFGLTDSAGYYRWLLGNTSRTGGTAGGTEYARLTASSFNHTGNITVNGNSVLTTSNYNSYAPTLTGTGASGTWGISITGNAATATTATTATNIAGGGAGQVPYNTGSGATAFVAAGTAGQLLQSNGTSAPSWVTNTAASKSYVNAQRILFGF